MEFDANIQKQIDAAFTEQLSERERKFIRDRADGLSLLAAWSGAGYDLMPGWQRDARDLEKRLAKRRAEIERPYHEQMKAIERAQHRARTAPLRRELCITLRAIITADVGAAIGEDGRLDVKTLKASGIGPAIQSICVGDDGRLKSIQLHSKMTAARMLDQLA